MSTSPEGRPPLVKTKLESAKSAVDQARIAETQLLQEILALHGAGAHPASPITLTAEYANNLVEVLGVLRGIAENAIRAEEVIQRVAPQASLIDDSWVERAVAQEIDWERINSTRKSYGLPPLIKGPGYVEPPAAPVRGVANEAVTGMRGATPGPAIVDEIRDYRRIVRNSADPGTAWVLAADYTRFRSWCWDHGVDHLNKRLVGFATPGLWPHWLSGVARPVYALGYDARERPDYDQFVAFMEERGGVKWEPPRRGEIDDVHGS